MDEDRLSPQLGRLIDSAKEAARRSTASASQAEGVALLSARECVYVGHAGEDPADPSVSAAEVALSLVHAAGDEEVVAAAIAAADDPSATVYPSAESHRCLAGLNPDLPVVVKQHGRWVLLLLSQIPVSG